jgi:Ion channel
VARLKASHGYGWVLLLTVCSFLFAAVAPDGTWERGVFVLIEAGTLVLALWTSGLSQDFRVGVFLGGIGIVAAAASVVNDGARLEGVIWIVNVVLVVAIALTIGVGIVDQREVNRQSVTGAVCAYILVGILFMFVFGAAAALGSGPFFAQGTDGTTSLRLYFSYVTLATLGYGDYTPAGDFGHTAAIVEALFGQLYLVTVVALLVANIGTQRRADAPPSNRQD